MSQVRVIAIDQHDGRAAGDDYLTTERQARQLVARGLAKMAADMPRNKMMPPPANKGSPAPLPDAGEAQRQPSSPAAPVSPPKTASSSVRGARPAAKKTRLKMPPAPRRARAAASSS